MAYVGQNVMSRTIPASTESPTDHIRARFEITDRGGMFPVTGGDGKNAHVFERGAETSLCGHVSTDEKNRSVARHASHDNSLVFDHNVCERCSQSVRKRVREDCLTTGNRVLDVAIRAEVGDELTVKTPDDTYTLVVEDTGFRCGRVQLEGHAADPDDDGIEHFTDALRVSVKPDGSIEITAPGDLTAALGSRDYETGDLRADGRRVMADGGVKARRVEEAAAPNCGARDCDNRGAAKIRGTWFCPSHYQELKEL